MLPPRAHRPLLITLLISAAAGAQPSPEDRAAAESLFRDGRRLMDEGKVAEGCRKLEESQRLDPAPGTLLNLAVCHEREGKIATAWAELQTALAQAKKDGRADREELARARIAEIEPILPRLTLIVPPDARLANLVVTRNGSPLQSGAWGTAIPVDPGEVVIEAEAPGHKKWRSVVRLEPKGSAEVTVPTLEKAPEAPKPVATPEPVAPPPPPPAPTKRELGPRSTAGLVLGGVGVASLGVGAFFGLRALSKRSDSDGECPTVDGRERCSTRGVELNESARTAARAADVTVGLGLLAVGAGAYLFLSDPVRTGKRAPAIGVAADTRSAVATLGGAF